MMLKIRMANQDQSEDDNLAFFDFLLFDSHGGKPLVVRCHKNTTSGSQHAACSVAEYLMGDREDSFVKSCSFVNSCNCTSFV